VATDTTKSQKATSAKVGYATTPDKPQKKKKRPTMPVDDGWTEEEVVLPWKCTSCGRKGIDGDLTVCPSCGNARSDDELNAAWEDAVKTGFANVRTVETPDEISELDPDWYCVCARVANRSNTDTCRACGRSREDGEIDPEASDMPQEVTEGAPYTPPEKKEARSPYSELDAAKDYNQRAYRHNSSVALSDAIGTLMVVMAVAAVLGGLGWLIYAYTQTEPVAGSLSVREWARSVSTQRWVDDTETAWCSTITERAERAPIDGQGERAGIRITRRTEKQDGTKSVKKGTKKVTCTHMKDGKEVCGKKPACYQPPTPARGPCKVVNNKTGRATKKCPPKPKKPAKVCPPAKCSTPKVPKHDHDVVDNIVQVPVYRDWCTYETQEWVSHRTFTESGAGASEPFWPTATTTDDIRKSGKTEKYTLRFDYTNRKGKPDATSKNVSLSEYQTWSKGDPAVLMESALGTVNDVYHKGKEPKQ